MQTPVSVQGGGTISILFITPHTDVFVSNSIPSSSGGTQAFASSTGFFPFGMSTSAIPSVLLSFPLAVSTSMTSMASGLASFECFPFGSGHIPHSNPSLGSVPFSSTGQNYNPFQGWTNPTVSGLGAGNQSYFVQQGNMLYSSVNSFQNFSPCAHAWNPCQGLSAPFNTSLGGNFTGYGNFSAGVGQTSIFFWTTRSSLWFRWIYELLQTTWCLHKSRVFFLEHW